VTSFPTRAQVRLYHESNPGSSVAMAGNQSSGNYLVTYNGAAGSGRYYIRLFVPWNERPVGALDYNMKLTIK